MKKILHLIYVTLAVQNCIWANSIDSSEGVRDPHDQISRISECNVQGILQPKIASAGINGGFTLGASFLYQQSSVDLLTAARTVNITGMPADGLIAKEQIDTMDYKWQPGMRVSAGYIFSQRDQLKLNITWTHLRGKGSSEVLFNDPTFKNGSLKPVWFPFLLGPLADQATSTWDCKLNLLDGTFGRSFFLGKWLVMQPYGGVRGAWINQDYLAKYHAAWMIDTTGTGNLTLSFKDTRFDAQNKFKGVGLLFGLETDWYVTRNFCAFTNFKTSLLYAKFDITQTSEGQIIIPISTIPTIIVPETISMTRGFHRIRPSLEGEIGIKWEKFFCGNSYRLFMGVSYEFSFWFCQPLFENVTNYLDGVQNSFATSFVDPRNLQFQGINIQAGFDF
jgi:hypothetical protein